MAGTWLERTMQRGRRADYFPHQLWFIMDNPVRRLLVNPRQLIDRLELSGSEQVLEVGPGPGLFSVELARRLTTGRLQLLELQPEMLAKARRKLDRAGRRNVGFHLGDAGGRLPFPDAGFDVAFLAAVLGEVTDKPACLPALPGSGAAARWPAGGAGVLPRPGPPARTGDPRPRGARGLPVHRGAGTPMELHRPPPAR